MPLKSCISIDPTSERSFEISSTFYRAFKRTRTDGAWVKIVKVRSLRVYESKGRVERDSYICRKFTSYRGWRHALKAVPLSDEKASRKTGKGARK